MALVRGVLGSTPGSCRLFSLSSIFTNIQIHLLARPQAPCLLQCVSLGSGGGRLQWVCSVEYQWLQSGGLGLFPAPAGFLCFNVVHSGQLVSSLPEQVGHGLITAGLGLGWNVITVD